MNKKEHTLNGLLLGAGVGVMVEPSMGAETAKACTAMTVPIVLGTLLPDLDTAYGNHRKTGHNIFLLLGLGIFPYYFQNLAYVWMGVLTHYILDLLGTKRGLALLWPLSDHEYDLPIGVATSSAWAWIMTLFITTLELLVLFFYFRPVSWAVAKQWGLQVFSTAQAFIG